MIYNLGMDLVTLCSQLLLPTWNKYYIPGSGLLGPARKNSHSKQTHFSRIPEFQERLCFLTGSSEQHSAVAVRIDLPSAGLWFLIVSAPSRRLLLWLDRPMSGLPLPPEDLLIGKWSETLVTHTLQRQLLGVCVETAFLFFHPVHWRT